MNYGPRHGILALLITNPARSGEIHEYFPNTRSSSTLTEMRRAGLIEKPGSVTSPWKITVKGLDYLASLPNYTPEIYWRSVWGSWQSAEVSNLDVYIHRTLRFPKDVTISKFAWEQPLYLQHVTRFTKGACS